jgi:hypothetical protein
MVSVGSWVGGWRKASKRGVGGAVSRNGAGAVEAQREEGRRFNFLMKYIGSTTRGPPTYLPGFSFSFLHSSVRKRIFNTFDESQGRRYGNFTI